MTTILLNIPLFKYKTSVVELTGGMAYMKFIPSNAGNSLTLFCVGKSNMVDTYFIADSESNFVADMHPYKSFWFERASSLGVDITYTCNFLRMKLNRGKPL